MKIGEYIIIGFFIFLFGGTFFLVHFTEQEINKINIDCNKLRVCIDLELDCYTKTIKNNFLGYKWTITNDLSLEEMKEYYIKECIKELGIKGEKT